MNMLYILIKIIHNVSDRVELFFLKMLNSITISLTVVPILYLGDLVDMYFLFDIGFLEILLISLTGSLFMGIWKHLKLRTFSKTRMLLGFIEQITIVVVALIMFNAFSHIKEFARHQDAMDYFNLLWKTIVVSYPATSLFNSMYYVTNGKFPPVGWMKRMKNFQKNLNLQELTSTVQTQPIKDDIQG